MQNYHELTVSAIDAHKEKRKTIITGLTTLGTYVVRKQDLTPRKLLTLCREIGLLNFFDKGLLSVKRLSSLEWEVIRRADNQPLIRLTASTRTMQGL